MNLENKAKKTKEVIHRAQIVSFALICEMDILIVRDLNSVIIESDTYQREQLVQEANKPGSIPSVLGESIGARIVSPWISISLQSEPQKYETMIMCALKKN